MMTTMETKKKAVEKPLKAVEIDIKLINHEQRRTRKSKTGQETKQCKMTYNKKTFRFITPKAKAPFGRTIGIKDEKNTSPYDKYSIEINLEGSEEIEQFKLKLEALNHSNVDFTVDSSKEWWGKTMSKDTVEDAVYGSLIKVDKKGEYPDRFKIKLPFASGEPLFKVFDENKQKINFWKTVDGKTEVDWSWAKQQMFVEAVVECEGLYIVDKKVYCVFKAMQLKVYPPDSLEDYAFGDDDAETPMATIVERMPKLALDDTTKNANAKNADAKNADAKKEDGEKVSDSEVEVESESDDDGEDKEDKE